LVAIYIDVLEKRNCKPPKKPSRLRNVRELSDFQQNCEKACVIPGKRVSKYSTDNAFNTLHHFSCESFQVE